MTYGLALRLLCAARQTYAIGPDGRTPEYLNTLATDDDDIPPSSRCAGYTDGPKGFQRGLQGTHAGFVATIPEGIVVALRGTLPVEESSHAVEAVAAGFRGLGGRDLLEPFAAAERIRAAVQVAESAVSRFASDWLTDANADLVPAPAPFSGQVHRGFLNAYRAVWADVVGLVDALASTRQTIFVTGHSKGGAMAVLVAQALQAHCPTHRVVGRTFAAPRVGDRTFAKAYDEAVPDHIRYEFADDIVPHLPVMTSNAGLVGIGPQLASGILQFDPGYGSVGQLCYVRDKAATYAADLDEAKRNGLESQRLADLRLIANASFLATIGRNHSIDVKSGYVDAPYRGPDR